MTKDEILAMKPGRELDALVENMLGIENIQKWCTEDSGELEQCLFDWDNDCRNCVHLEEHGTNEGCEHYQTIILPYSTDISAAWEVVAKFKGYCYLFQYNNWIDGKWEAKLLWRGARGITGEGDTAPEAICKAALLAKIGGETE